MERNNNYARIDLDQLRTNFINVRKKAGTKVLMIVKADAYGHGAVPVAQALDDLCDFYGVASFYEALELRRAGIRTPILMLGHTPTACFPEAIRLGVRPAIFRYADALALSEAAQKQAVTAPFHFAVDTGLSRIGFQVTEEDADLCKKISELPNLEAEGLFSHFATADSADQTWTLEQEALFVKFDGMLRQRGVAVKLRHLENSAALVNFSHHYDMVRAGIVVFGMHASDEVRTELVDVKPVLSWHSHVTFVKPLEAGRRVSYGGLHTMERRGLVATVAVGYADGYRRSLIHRFYVLIRGRKAPVLGKICMDQIMVDVTDIPGVEPGDPVVLIGTDGDSAVTADEMARVAGTINYDITCGLSRRVPRVYVRDGETVRTVNYLLDAPMGG